MSGSILGNRVRRTEDPELLTRGGTYVADLVLENKAHAFFVRSSYPHGLINSVDIAEALGSPGVIAVITAADIDVPPHHGFVKVHNDFAHPPLAIDRVRHVGDPVAMVVAETYAQAADAAELVFVDIEPLEAIVDPESAFDEDKPLIFPDHGSNIAVSATDPRLDDIFDDADHVMRGRYVNQRVAPVPMETNSAAATWGDDGRLTFYAATQMPHLLKMLLGSALKIDKSEIRVIAPHVGGGFGAKAGTCHEYTALALAAKIVGRPVIWTESRSENMTSLVHGRGQVQYVELGLKKTGEITGMRCHVIGDAGAYPNVGSLLPAGTRRMANGPYKLPKLQFDIAVGVTNTTSTGAYRGAGRPEAASLLERALDQAGIELGIDPIEMRRINLLENDVFPFKTLTGLTYDSGDYLTPLEKAVEVAGYDELRAEQQRRRDSNERWQLGIGVASYVEVTSGGGGSEFGSLDIHEDGSATVMAGTSAHGQGHQTAFAMLVSDRTGIPVDRITLVQSDTDLVRTGGGTGGSRSLQLGGPAVVGATEVVIDKGKRLAAHLLEASVDDIVVDVATGSLSVAGVPAKSIGWGELAVKAATVEPSVLGERDDDRDGLAGQFDFSQADGTFPFGTHISVVEIDMETGFVRPVRHIAVDDAGTVLNPLLVEGQQHGGIAQGMSQALYEEMQYDADGNPVTASLLNYPMPSAAEFPLFFEPHSTETPTPLNPLGAKGIGEASTIGSTPAVQNAVVDALTPLGIRHLDMPATPERVWRAIEAARAGNPPEPWSEPPAVFATLAVGIEVDKEGLAAAESI